MFVVVVGEEEVDGWRKKRAPFVLEEEEEASSLYHQADRVTSRSYWNGQRSDKVLI